jgi:predicted secreted protein
MSAGISIKGREVIITTGGQNFLGLQGKGITVNNELIETSDDNSQGVAEYDAIPGKKTVELSLSGMTKNLELMRTVLGGGSQIIPILITYPDSSTLTGDFAITSFGDSGGFNEGRTFELSLSASGAVVFLAGVPN